MEDNKVLITGMGLIDALGLNLGTNWANLVEGKSGGCSISLFDPKYTITKIACEIPDGFEELA